VARASGNDGTRPDVVVMRHAGRTGQGETIVFEQTSRGIGALALEGLGRCVDAVFARAGLTMADVAWVVPHQPNGVLLAAIAERFGIAAEKTVPVVNEVGNVGSASVAVGLDRLMQERRPRADDVVLLMGVGSGLSFAAMLYRVG
jgi:3-oxoacyl-[acyl-carrier-protein] synthase III